MSIFFLILVCAVSSLAQPLSLCDLPGELAGQEVQLKGVIAFGTHSTTMNAEEACSDGASRALAVLFADVDRPDAFYEDAYRAALRVVDPRRLVPEVCGVFRGTLLRAESFKVSGVGDARHGNGFGFNGLTEWAIVIKGVSDARSCVVNQPLRLKEGALSRFRPEELNDK